MQDSSSVPPLSQPVNDAAQQQNRAGKTPKQIRLLNLLLCVTCFVFPLLGLILWAVCMKQYKLPVFFKIIIIFTSGLVAPTVALAGFIGNIDTSGAQIYPLLIPGLIITLAPFVYTFVRPLGSTNPAN
jgi:uncharacterized membrane protein